MVLEVSRLVEVSVILGTIVLQHFPTAGRQASLMMTNEKKDEIPSRVHGGSVFAIACKPANSDQLDFDPLTTISTPIPTAQQGIVREFGQQQRL